MEVSHLRRSAATRFPFPVVTRKPGDDSPLGFAYRALVACYGHGQRFVLGFIYPDIARLFFLYPAHRRVEVRGDFNLKEDIGLTYLVFRIQGYFS